MTQGDVLKVLRRTKWKSLRQISKETGISLKAVSVNARKLSQTGDAERRWIRKEGTSFYEYRLLNAV